MNRRELVAIVARVTRLSENDVFEVIAEATDVIVDTLSTGEPVKITGLGTLSIRDRPFYQAGRRPVSGPTEAHFRAAKSLKARINGKEVV